MRSPPHFTTLVLLTAVSILSLNMIVPSLPAIAAEFGASYAGASLLLSGYLAVTAILQPVFGPLSDRFGRRPVLLAALTIFVLATLGCVFAPDLNTLLAFRALQGCGIATYVVALAVVRDTRSGEDAAGTIGQINMAMALAPMLGPMLGGVLEAAFDWRASFVVLAVSGLGLLALSWVDVGETRPESDGEGGNMLAGIGQLARSTLFWANAFCMAFSISAFYAFLAGAPHVASTVFGLSPAQLGLATGSITGGFLIGSFLSARFTSRVGLVRMLLAGRLVGCTGLLAGLSLFLMGAGSLWLFFAATFFSGIGNGVSTPAASAGAMSVRPDLAGTAAGVSGALIVAMGAVFTALTGRLVTGVSPAETLLSVMLLVSLAGLAAALLVWRSARLEHH